MIHKTADVSKDAQIGENTSVWNQSQVRENAIIGNNCVLSKNVYICSGVKIGNNVKIQNNVSVYQGVTIEDGVFVGPHVCFTNDKTPRAINPDGTLKTGSGNPDDWEISKTIVKYGASIGANSTIVCGVNVGRFALIGAGSVVTKDVKDNALVYGNPAVNHGFVCDCGEKLVQKDGFYECPKCKKKYEDLK
jgi:UDP-2-acetamido-3-amino-2,3-dideoxy-glucuronate N-acetyltransferase